MSILENASTSQEGSSTAGYLPKILEYAKKIFQSIEYFFTGCRRNSILPALEKTPEQKLGSFILCDEYIVTSERIKFKAGPVRKNRLLDFLIDMAFLPAVSLDKNKLENSRAIYQMKHKRHSKRLKAITIDKVTLDTFAIFNPAQDFLPAEKQKWIVFLGPNNKGYEQVLEMLYLISQHTGASIYTGNYRGVGNSTGYPSTSQDLLVDADTMIQHLIHSGVQPQNILCHGHSMGGGVLADVVTQYPGMHYCSDRSYSSFRDAAKTLVPIFGRFVGRLDWKLNPVEAVENITGTVIILTNEKDGVINKSARMSHGLSKRSLKKECIFINLEHKSTRYYPPRRKKRIDKLLFTDDGVAAHSNPLIEAQDQHQIGYQEYIHAVKHALKL